MKKMIAVLAAATALVAGTVAAAPAAGAAGSAAGAAGSAAGATGSAAGATGSAAGATGSAVGTTGAVGSGAGATGSAATAAAGSADFGAQARAAGLTAGQAAFLDRESAFYLAAMGGNRVGPNVIDLNGTGTVRIALPGEAAPRDLPLADGTRLAPVCTTGGAAYTHFCAYPNEYFRGTAIDMYHCIRYGVPWSSTGSWDNNQTAGTQPVQYYTDGRSRLLPAARSSYLSGVNWAIVSGIKPC